MALIGDQFCEEGPFVNGVWVNVRSKIDKISLWTKGAKNAEIQLKIGYVFITIIFFNRKVTFEKDSNDKNRKINTISYIKYFYKRIYL